MPDHALTAVSCLTDQLNLLRRHLRPIPDKKVVSVLKPVFIPLGVAIQDSPDNAFKRMVIAHDDTPV